MEPYFESRFWGSDPGFKEKSSVVYWKAHGHRNKRVLGLQLPLSIASCDFQHITSSPYFVFKMAVVSVSQGYCCI